MDLEFKPRSCWEVYNTPEQREEMEQLAERYLAFLTRCKTERETIDYIVERLTEAGFSTDNFMGQKVMRTLQGKAIFIARRGKAPMSQGVQLICAHADTPRLDLKQRPLQEQAGVAQAKTHYYGGIRKYQWFARPLALHGVVVKADGAKVNVVLGEDPSEPVFAISDLLPHLGASQNEVPLGKAFEAEKMNLLIGHKPYKEESGPSQPEPGQPTEQPLEAKDQPDEKSAEKAKENGNGEKAQAIKTGVLKLLNEKYGIVEEDLYSSELQAVPAGPARRVGLDSALLGGYGQDDRICVFAALEAFLQDSGTPARTQCLMFWDKEEIGSEGSTGAKSRFFEYCMNDLIFSWEPNTRFSEVMLKSRAISADVHAAIDPDWQDLHEKLNAALLGNGPCFCKFTGSRGKYEANDAHPEYVAWLRGILNQKGIPWQMAELGKVDGGGGGTVAMHLASYGMNIIDCGPAVLSMHSPFEICSQADLYATVLAFSTFLGA